MKYKLLTEKGIYFVCLEDGTKIPYQICTSVRQHLRDQAIVTVDAYVNMSFSSETMLFNGSKVTIYGNVLEDLIGLSVNSSHNIDGYETIIATFSMHCELVDTVEQPKTPNKA